MKWKIEFDEDNGMWLYTSETTHALNRAGYAAGGYLDHKTGKKFYTLHKADDRGYPIIHETESLDELNAYINLILPRD